MQQMKPRNIKRCPMCGHDTNRTSLTLLGHFISSAPLCAKCHSGMIEWGQEGAEFLQREYEQRRLSSTWMIHRIKILVPLYLGYVDGSFDSPVEVFCDDCFPAEGEGLTASETEQKDYAEVSCSVC